MIHSFLLAVNFQNHSFSVHFHLYKLFQFHGANPLFCEPYMDFLPRKKELWGKKCILSFNQGYSSRKYFYCIILWRTFYNKTDFVRKQKGYGINLRSICQGNDYNDGNSNRWRVVLAPYKSIEFLPLIFVLGGISLCSRGGTSLLPVESLDHLRKIMEWKCLPKYYFKRA